MRSIKIIFLISVFALLKISYSKCQSNTKLSFYDGNWAHLIPVLESTNKSGLLIFSARWCSNCKRLNEITFNNERVVNYLKSNYILMEIDVDTSYDKALAKQFGVTAYPTIVVVNNKGVPLLTSEGYHDPEDLIKTLSVIESE